MLPTPERWTDPSDALLDHRVGSIQRDDPSDGSNISTTWYE